MSCYIHGGRQWLRSALRTRIVSDDPLGLFGDIASDPARPIAPDRRGSGIGTLLGLRSPHYYNAVRSAGCTDHRARILSRSCGHPVLQVDDGRVGADER
ncbi:Hypothetical protein NTJ_01340 [Nesidiocoris tenuis]|uniref:Uncharacterized protein n=1 Tax=Nesidiocoris tenuis TaxID=355587 RepID=A0ABN7AB76_9HEMI|nr:Hypothetical protein NTJ_01340 [Nesidiocoris tenuis]